MLRKERFDAFAIEPQLGFESSEEFGQATGEQGLGLNRGRAAGKGRGAGKDFDAPLHGLGPPELVRVEELLPPASATLGTSAPVAIRLRPHPFTLETGNARRSP